MAKVKEKVIPTKKKIPYTNRVWYEPDKAIYDSFAEALGNLHLELPLTDDIQVPTYKKFMRDILNIKKKVTKTVAVMTRFGDKLPAILGDPGIPTVSHAIVKTNIFNALYNLGAGVSVMPYSLFKN